jgi:hypothetical protein
LLSQRDIDFSSEDTIVHSFPRLLARALLVSGAFVVFAVTPACRQVLGIEAGNLAGEDAGSDATSPDGSALSSGDARAADGPSDATSSATGDGAAEVNEAAADGAPDAASSAADGSPAVDDGAAEASEAAVSPATLVYSNYWDFETPENRDWSFTPNNDPNEPGTLAGYDIGKGLGLDGAADEVFANLSDPSWFGADETPVISGVFGQAHKGYVVADFWTQMSSSPPVYVMNVWDTTTGTVIQQNQIPWSSPYTEHTLRVEIDNAVANGDDIAVQFGFQGSGDLEWMRVDDVSVEVYVFE